MASPGPTSDPTPKEISDTTLVAGVVRRDENALRCIIAAHGKYVFGMALQILKDPALAEEVAQDTLLALWENPHGFDISKGSLRPFLMGVARFKAIDCVRQEELVRSQEALLSEVALVLEAPPSDQGVAEALAMKSAVALLPPPKRDAIFLAYYRGLTYREVALVLDRPEGTVKTQLRDSMTRLRVILSERESA